MVGTMAKVAERIDDDLVFRARTQAEALGRLYEMCYERILGFCVYRLFNKEIAEDITSAVFLEVARGIGAFRGHTVKDFQSWLYAIAANQANAYIRKTTRRKKLLEEAAGMQSIAQAMVSLEGNRDAGPASPTVKSRKPPLMSLRSPISTFSGGRTASMRNKSLFGTGSKVSVSS